ncbi:hypothetical protein HMPREF2557_09875 [Neisseria sp. HMSC064F03]|nr:hypothetical protein HMPREF2557_09875 [Neisseria sp. HMSC064F03]
MPQLTLKQPIIKNKRPSEIVSDGLLAIKKQAEYSACFMFKSDRKAGFSTHTQPVSSLSD